MPSVIRDVLGWAVGLLRPHNPHNPPPFPSFSIERSTGITGLSRTSCPLGDAQPYSPEPTTRTTTTPTTTHPTTLTTYTPPGSISTGPTALPPTTRIHKRLTSPTAYTPGMWDVEYNRYSRSERQRRISTGPTTLPPTALLTYTPPTGVTQPLTTPTGRITPPRILLACPNPTPHMWHERYNPNQITGTALPPGWGGDNPRYRYNRAAQSALPLQPVQYSRHKSYSPTAQPAQVL
jgi:hypothetical protein